MFTVFDAWEAGKKGGSAKTPQKQRAARDNGKRGGRPPSRTLTERLLRRSILPPQHKYIERAYDQLFESEKQKLAEHFQTKGILGEEPLHSKLWRSRSRRIPKEIRYIIKKFRLAANHYLKEAPAAKPYLVEYQSPSPEAQERWELMHPGLPCPPRKVRTDVRTLPGFNYFADLYARDPALTAKDMADGGGSRWTLERAEAALAYIKATRSSP